MLLNLLQQATAEADRTEFISPVDQATPPPPSRFRGLGFRAPVDEEARARRRKGLLVGLGVGGAIIVVALLVLASVLSKMFGDVGGSLDKNQLGLNAPTTSAGQPTNAGTTIKPVKATVFSPGGEADSADLAGLAIDGNLATAWPTDTYTDAVPFPNFKDGVGLLLQLPRAAALSAVTIDLSSTGTQVQIRSAPTPTPAKLSDTTELTPPTRVQPGHNRIPVNNSTQTSNVLVWIPSLGTTNGKSRSDVYEITLESAS
jgi:putative peptidoglycan lipid II flippase